MTVAVLAALAAAICFAASSALQHRSTVDTDDLRSFGARQVRAFELGGLLLVVTATLALARSQAAGDEDRQMVTVPPRRPSPPATQQSVLRP